MNLLSFFVQLFSIIGGVYKLLELTKVYLYKITNTEIEFENDEESTGLELGNIVKDK